MSAARRTYSIEERRAIVAEVLRRYEAREGTYLAIAEKLGVAASDFHYWRRAHAPLASVASSPGPRAGVARAAAAPPPPYPPADRERLRLAVDRLRAKGRSLLAACAAVRISTDSYRKWVAAAAPAPAMRPVEIMALVPASPQALMLVPAQPAAASASLTLVAPGGYRVEGLAVETAAQLLRALSC